MLHTDPTDTFEYTAIKNPLYSQLALKKEEHTTKAPTLIQRISLFQEPSRKVRVQGYVPIKMRLIQQMQ